MNDSFHGDEHEIQDEQDRRQWEQYDHDVDYLYELAKDSEHGFNFD